MSAIRRWSVVVPLGILLAGTGGCTKSYPFELVCVIRSAADGTPLSGVRALLDTSGRADQPDVGIPTNQPTTDAAGRVTDEFSAYPIDFDPGRPAWLLKLDRDGFHSEVVDIKPAAAPEKLGSKSMLYVVVYMRPKSEAK
jgi:hypothetical protein